MQRSNRVWKQVPRQVHHLMVLVGLWGETQGLSEPQRSRGGRDGWRIGGHGWQHWYPGGLTLGNLDPDRRPGAGLKCGPNTGNDWCGGCGNPGGSVQITSESGVYDRSGSGFTSWRHSSTAAIKSLVTQTINLFPRLCRFRK